MNGYPENPTAVAERVVLYVEDNPANLRLVEQLLRRRPGLRMISAHEPRLGFDLAVAHQPNLVLLDINLPGMDGFEVLRRMRASAVLENTPVIAISANATPGDIARGRAAGFADYLIKPIDIQHFYAVLDTVLDQD